MKRASLLLAFVAALLMPATLQAQSVAYVSCSDGTVQQYDLLSVGDVTFSADGAYLFIVAQDGVTVTYPVSFVSAIEFVKPDGSQPQTLDTAFDVAFDAADDNAYSEVTEKVTTAETATNDYGDFVENYDDDEESKGTVTITYGETSVAVTYSPTSLKGSAVLVQSGTATDVVAYGTKKVDYVLKGATSDGSFTLYSAKKSKLTLDGVSIRNSDGAAINMPKKTMGSTEYGGKTVYVVLKDGTTSTLEDGSTYSSAISGEDMKGTIFAEGQLIFSGKGTLNVKSNYGHGIASDDYVRVRGGKHCPVINVNSAKDGFSINDYFLMCGGRVTVNAADEGINVGKGYVDIRAGQLTVNSVDDAITTPYDGEADGSFDSSVKPSITLAGGLVKLTTTGPKGMGFKSSAAFTQTGGIAQVTVKGAGSKAINADADVTLTGGKLTAIVEGVPVYDDEADDVSSAAGIRSKGALTLGGTTVALKATADGGKGINSVGLVTVKAGSVSVVTNGVKYSSGGHSSRARGVTADTGLTVSGGTLRVRSADDAVYTPASITLTSGVLHAFSTSGNALTGTLNQQGGWLAETTK